MHKRCAEGEGRGGLSKFSDALPCAKKFDLKIDEILKCADPDQVTNKCALNKGFHYKNCIRKFLSLILS